MKDFSMLSKRQERLMKWIEIDLQRIPNLTVNDCLIKAVFIYYLLVSNIVRKEVCDEITADFIKWKINPTKFINKYIGKIDNSYHINLDTYKKEQYIFIRDFIFEDLWGYFFINMNH